MNDKQGNVIFLAALAFICSALYVPWQCVSQSGRWGNAAKIETQVVYGFLWNAPTATTVSPAFGVLALEWVALAVFAAVSFLVAKGPGATSPVATPSPGKVPTQTL